MRILEARDGFIKFETEEKVAISSFLQIDGFKRYIAQVIKISTFESKNIGYARLVFIYDGSISEYDNTLPDVSSIIAPLNFSDLNSLKEYSNPITAGYFIQDETKLFLEKNCFNKKMLISIDNQNNCNKLIYNLKQRFLKSQNVLIIDLAGLSDGKKFFATKDFKLPLNYDALKFLYEDCLNDATSDSKGLIKEIFADLANYAKSVPFLPFSTLKNIIDDMVNNSHVFKLIVLKNKLTKFNKLNYFANSANEVETLSKILSNNNVTIDLSKLDSIFQNRYLEEIFNLLNNIENKPQVFVITSNFLNKKSLKTILTNDNISTTLVSNSHFKYINEIKLMFKNFIIEPSFTNNEVFKTYRTFLENMPRDTYLIVGEGTNYIPLVSLNKEYIEEAEIEIEEESIEEQTTYEQLAQDLDLSIEKDEQTQAIEKKSEDLIEKITEKLESENNSEIEIFEEEDEEIEDEVEEKEEFVEFNQTEDNEPQNELVTETLSEATEDSEDIVQKEEEIIELPQVEEEVVVEEISIPKDIVELTDDEVIEINEENETTEVIEITDEVQEQLLEEIEFPQVQEIMTENVEENNEENIIINEAEEISDNSISLTEIELSDDNIETIEITDEDLEMEDDSEIIELELDPLEKEIIEDVDKVYTSIKEDVITDNDLDFIDELNEDTSENETLESVSEEEFEVLPELEEENDDEILTEQLEEINDYSKKSEDIEILPTKENTTTTVPVYDAYIPQEDLVESDSFEQGDTVTHTKYGTGVVEKMIKYGAKTLYSINFDNVGRRLLDPTLTEIKKS